MKTFIALTIVTLAISACSAPPQVNRFGDKGPLDYPSCATTFGCGAVF
ncbi:MAG: hypothetical protein HRU31_18395 [Rhodobacteraceae bacterium]|nr:hypothetical protein [Paracoccaceae bacterium]